MNSALHQVSLGCLFHILRIKKIFLKTKMAYKIFHCNISYDPEDMKCRQQYLNPVFKYKTNHYQLSTNKI